MWVATESQLCANTTRICSQHTLDRMDEQRAEQALVDSAWPVSIAGTERMGERLTPSRRLPLSSQPLSNARRVTILSAQPKNALWRRAYVQLRRYGIVPYILGWWLRHKFTKSGVLRAEGGLPLVSVENHGGHVEAGNCAFFPGVRLECWTGAQIRIGTGTYLNRGVEIVAA